MKINLTIPVLNEEKTLKEQMYKLMNFIDQNQIEKNKISITIADNGSTDSTPEISMSLAKENENIYYVRTEFPGVGSALKSSWQAVPSDYLGYMDLDFSTSLEHLLEVIHFVNQDQHDFITGSRWSRKSLISGRSFQRTITSWTLNRVVNIYFGTTIKDSMIGFKFIKNTSYLDLISKYELDDNWFFCAEILILAYKKDLKIKTIPVKWTDDKESKVKILRTALNFLQTMKIFKRKNML
jgi:glycosyltransferase involved in cell wall biosynthesis